MANFRESLVNRIEALLGDKTQKWLSVHSGLNTAFISRLMAGTADVGLDELNGLATALGLSVTELVDPIFSKAKDSAKAEAELNLKNAAEILLKLEALPVNRKGFVLALIFRDESYLKLSHPSLRQAYKAISKFPGKA